MAIQIDTHVTTPIARSSDVNVPDEVSSPAVVKAVTPPNKPADTVTLSLSAHIHQLRSEGFNPNQISVSLGVSAQTVSSYLGALHTTSSQSLPLPSPPNQTVAPAPVASPAGAQTSTAR